MPTRGEKHPQQADEAVCEVISLADTLKKHIIIRRNAELRAVVERLESESLKANGHICRAWLRNDHLGDLPPAA